MIIPLLFGLVGAAILVALGTWQVQRLVWKNDVLASIAESIAAEPQALPLAPNEAAHRYLPVRVSGVQVGRELLVLASLKRIGAVYRVISAYQTDGRRILVDRGIIKTGDADKARAALGPDLVGNLYWPDEVDSFTPAPDPKTGVWYARDIQAMAAALKTVPVLLVLRNKDANSGVTPLPVDGASIPNNHFSYAITWFGLAIAWLGMTGFFLWRIRQRLD